jgi:phytoene desaturase
MSKHIIVIGSGFGGLAAAVRLAARGYEVDLLEKRDKLGGRAYVYEVNGYTFDGGPTVVTAPFLFDEIFQATGRRKEDYFTLRALDPFYRIFNHEGRSFDYNDNTEFILGQIERWNPADKRGYQEFIATTKAIFQKGFVELADKPFLKLTDMLKIVPDLLRLQSYKMVYPYVAQFVENEFLRRVFSFHPLLVGGNPFDTTSIYALIHYLEREWGVHYAMGGTGSIVKGLGRLLEELGGRIRLNTEVEEITVSGRRVTGVRLRSGEVMKADLVVSNADVAYTYRSMINRAHRRKFTNRKIESMRYSMSLFVI